MVAHRRIAGGDRQGQIDDVADLQPLWLDRCGQLAVEDRVLEIGFAPGNDERLAAGQNIDDLNPAPDQQLVHRDGLRRRIPGKGDGSRTQPLRGLELVDAFLIMRDLARLEIDLLVAQQQTDSQRIALAHRRCIGRNGHRDNPTRHRCHHELVRRKGGPRAAA